MKKLPALDGVRALAVLLIVAYHMFHMQLKDVDIGLSNTLATVLGFGWIGVPLFFTLSGFLVAGRICESALSGRFTFGRFYADRAFRILPIAYAFLFVTGMQWGSVGFNWWTITNALYVSNYFGVSFPAHFWSLQVEEQFYTLAPLVIVALVGRGLGRQALARLLAVGVPLAMAYRAVSLLCFPVPASDGGMDPYTNGANYLDFFFAGTLVAMVKDDPRVLRVRASIVAWFESSNAATLALLALAIPLAMFATPMNGRPAVRSGLSLATIYPFACVWSALVIAWFATAGERDDIVTRAFCSRPAALVAKLSYSIYVWHFLLMGALDIHALQAHPWLATLAQLSVDVAVMMVVAGISYALIELPFLKLRDLVRRILARGVTRTVAAPETTPCPA